MLFIIIDAKTGEAWGEPASGEMFHPGEWRADQAAAIRFDCAAFAAAWAQETPAIDGRPWRVVPA